MGIELHIALTVMEGKQVDFEQWFETIFVPALRRQDGFQSAALMAEYSDDVREAIGAAKAEFPVLIVIRFDSEQQRAAWVATDDHEHAWGMLQQVAHHRAHFGWAVHSLVGGASA